jgi:hypothetical protein
VGAETCKTNERDVLVPYLITLLDAGDESVKFRISGVSWRRHHSGPRDRRKEHSKPLAKVFHR